MRPAIQGRIMIILGTRPEVIKLAPVIKELTGKAENLRTEVVFTGQHQQMARQAMDAFRLKPDVELSAMIPGASLGRMMARMVSELIPVMETQQTDWVLVQGDTTSAMVGALCAFYSSVKIGHVEAGLRSYNRYSPYPEEANRAIIGQIADLHFAPTPRAVHNLRQAGVRDEAIKLTGNTIVDAVRWISDELGDEHPDGISDELKDKIANKRIILVTSHRRESFGEKLENICNALARAVSALPSAAVVFPVHLNPRVQSTVQRILGGTMRVNLIAPLEYRAFIWLMKHSHLIVTDSGGIQEEAATLGIPVLVARNITERPEVVEAGGGLLVGTGANRIEEEICRLFADESAWSAMARADNPFGDGQAARRIVEYLYQEVTLECN